MALAGDAEASGGVRITGEGIGLATAVADCTCAAAGADACAICPGLVTGCGTGTTTGLRTADAITWDAAEGRGATGSTPADADALTVGAWGEAGGGAAGKGLRGALGLGVGNARGLAPPPASSWEAAPGDGRRP